jgi:phenylalanyl-tRNA synthetase alpha chain
MTEKINEVKVAIEAFNISDATTLETFRIQFLGSKNVIKDLFGGLKSVPNEEKRTVGQLLNELRLLAETKFEAAKEQLETSSSQTASIDTSRPGEPQPLGSRHPLSIIRSEIVAIFEKIGYAVSEGPEIEDDWHNFSALNFPPEHPARDMQDTFFIEKGEREMALRTHTSSVQVRVMENSTPPIRTISPGRVLSLIHI